MTIEVRLPQEGMSMQEGTIASWLVAVGATVAAGDPIVEIETDKVNFEVESPAAGTLVEIVAQPGEVVPVRAVIARIEPAS